MGDYFVFVAEPDGISQTIEIEIEKEDNINKIKEKIRAKCSPDYDLTPINRMLLFERLDSAEPLHALTKWYPDVTWGKPEAPLIVRVQPRAVASWNHNEVAQGDDGFTPSQLQQLNAVFTNIVMNSSQEKEYCISSVPSRIFSKVTSAYGIRTEAPKWNRSEIPNKLDSATFLNFEWAESQESNVNQRASYMEFLNQVSWPHNYKIVDVSKTGLLFSNVPLASYRFKGSIDVILLDNGNAESKNYKDNIRLGIELKKPDLKDQHHNQACIEQLCAASLNYENSVLTLLTDLNDAWFFIYFGSNAKLYKLGTSRSEAKFLLDNIFNQNELAQSCFPEDFVNRLSWNEFVKSFIPAVPGTHFLDHDNDDDDDGDEFREQDGDDSENFRKRKDNPRKRSANTKDDSKGSGTGDGHAKMLHFGGDAANELDLLDFIDDEEEKTQIVLKYVLDNVVPMLMFSDTADEKEKSSASFSSLQQVSSSHHVAPSQQQQNDEGSCEKLVSSCDRTSALSVQNLLHHNSAVRGIGT